MAESSVASANDEEKTVPNTPEVCYISKEQESINGDFARLIPASRTARIAFSEVVVRLRNLELGWDISSLEKYMHVDDMPVTLPEEQSDTDTETESLTIPKSIWTGYYRLNLEIPHTDCKIGWVVGRGRSELPNRGIDFLLTCSSAHDVSGRHARLIHHTSSHALMIVAGRRPIIINGIVELCNAQQAITAVATGLTFGDLAYRLVFTKLDPKLYARQLRQLNHSSHTVLPGFMSPTPSSTDYELRSYTVRNAFAEGSTCIMSSGVDKRTGALVAVKEMKRNARNSAALQREIEINKAVGSSPRVCRLVEVIYLDQRDANELGPNRIDKVFLIYSPLALSSLHNLIISNMHISDRLVIFKHCLQGLFYIHSKNLMHRDIKPGNIAIISRVPPAAMLIDFGQATFESTSIDHFVGTIRYLAPEVISLKMGSNLQPYDCKVDIWGLGLCGYQFFCHQTYLWQELNMQTYMQIRRRLEKPLGNADLLFHPIAALILTMLAWEVEERISAADALECEVLCGVAIDAESSVIKGKVTDPNKSQRKRHAEPDS